MSVSWIVSIRQSSTTILRYSESPDRRVPGSVLIGTDIVPSIAVKRQHMPIPADMRHAPITVLILFSHGPSIYIYKLVLKQEWRCHKQIRCHTEIRYNIYIYIYIYIYMYINHNFVELGLQDMCSDRESFYLSLKML